MRYCRCLLLFACLCVTIYMSAQECFKLELSSKTTQLKMDRSVLNSNTAFKFPMEGRQISGLSISGIISKYSPEYVVRVILKDKDGHEYLIMEAYEELYNDEIINFENHCEESKLMENIIPDSVKVYVYDASLQLFSLTVNEDIAKSGQIAMVDEIRNKQVHNKVNQINAYNSENGRPWVADITDLSLLPYEIKRGKIGIADDSSTGGFEYYSAGFFVVGHRTLQANRSLDNDPFVDSFDWRNRHGKNWITDVRNQKCTFYCTAFAALGCLEGLTKLYFNNADLNLDLSEQEIASCYDIIPHNANNPLSYAGVFNYIYEHGICDETAYPLDTLGCYDSSYNITCNSETISPNEIISTGSPETTFSSYMHDIKRNLIAHGPIYSGWHQSIYAGHAMTLVGYGKIKANDTITYYQSTNGTQTYYISIPSSFIGSTYWIFKSSDITPGGNRGYCNLLFDNMVGNNSNVYISKMTTPSYLGLPIISMNYTDNDIIVEDADGDGFFNWGISEIKPDGCPSWIPDTPDGDDSDNTKAIMDEYGHLSSIRPGGTVTLTNDYTISNTNVMLYDSFIIPYGRTFTISGPVMCMGNSTITVQSGGNLIVDGGVLANAAIILSPNSTVTIDNGGEIYTRPGYDFTAPVGCVVEVEEGSINGPYKKMPSQ